MINSIFVRNNDLFTHPHAQLISTVFQLLCLKFNYFNTIYQYRDNAYIIIYIYRTIIKKPI